METAKFQLAMTPPACGDPHQHLAVQSAWPLQAPSLLLQGQVLERRIAIDPAASAAQGQAQGSSPALAWHCHEQLLPASVPSSTAASRGAPVSDSDQVATTRDSPTDLVVRPEFHGRMHAVSCGVLKPTSLRLAPQQPRAPAISERGTGRPASQICREGREGPQLGHAREGTSVRIAPRPWLRLRRTT